MGGVMVLCSSKTWAEMQPMRGELGLERFPMTCENGGVVVPGNSEGQAAAAGIVLGKSRRQILSVLKDLHQSFLFRSFAQMSVAELVAQTSLSADSASLALQRQCSEPLLWQDEPRRLAEFTQQLKAADLTLTRGGRFLHVAGHTTKGLAAQHLLKHDAQMQPPRLTVAIGDAPIDQSMLDLVDIPIAIPDPDGVFHVKISQPPGIRASAPGPVGWAAALQRIMDRLA